MLSPVATHATTGSRLSPCTCSALQADAAAKLVTKHTYIVYIYIYTYQFTRSPPLAPLAEQPWVARFFFLAIETWDVIASKIGSSKLHSIFTSPIEAPITGCAHRHRQRPQHPFDRTHQMSDIPRDQNQEKSSIGSLAGGEGSSMGSSRGAPPSRAIKSRSAARKAASGAALALGRPEPA